MTPEDLVARFPYVEQNPTLGEASLAPVVPIRLSFRNRLDVTALVDSGAAVSVLPRSIGEQLGLVWAAQALSMRLTGNLANIEARGVLVEAEIAPLPPVRLVFAWANSDEVEILLGQMNFFLAFDVCFHRLRKLLEIRPAQSA